MYDVAIVGAGPAGATVSRYLGKAGYRICLIDKERFPRNKPCGGGFPPTIADEFPYLRSRQNEFLQAICHVGVLHSPNRKVILRGKADMAVAIRTHFDNILLEAAIDAGAEPLLGKRVKGIAFNDDGAILMLSDGSRMNAKAIVGADGVTSMVARSTTLNQRWPSSKITACRMTEIPATNKEIVNAFTDEREYHFFANLGGQPGYGWVFPKTETINVGLGIVGKYSVGLIRKFNLFVKHLKKIGLLRTDADTTQAKGALVPTGGPISRTVRARCLLVGDSAGMVNPLTGGGIVYAMKAARFAARVLSGCLQQDDFSADRLEQYHRAWMNEFGAEFKSQLIAQRIITGPFASTMFEIGSRDVSIQEIVSNMMSEGSQGRSEVLGLLGAVLHVCLREVIT